MHKPFQDLSSHKLQKHIANTSLYSLHSCLITDDWPGSEDEKEGEQKERTYWQTAKGRGIYERTCCSLSILVFLISTVKRNLIFLRDILTFDYKCQKYVIITRKMENHTIKCPLNNHPNCNISHQPSILKSFGCKIKR